MMLTWSAVLEVVQGCAVPRQRRTYMQPYTKMCRDTVSSGEGMETVVVCAEDETISGRNTDQVVRRDVGSDDPDEEDMRGGEYRGQSCGGALVMGVHQHEHGARQGGLRCGADPGCTRGPEERGEGRGLSRGGWTHTRQAVSS